MTKAPVRWLRKAQLRERYGGVTNRTIDRHVEQKKLPPPEYPFQNRIPMWRVDLLDESDRLAALAYRNHS
jgi:hypothetical protein